MPRAADLPDCLSNFLAVVFNGGARSVSYIRAYSVSACDENDIEPTVLDHPVVGALPCTYGELRVAIIPCEWNVYVLVLLVSVSVAGILVKIEFAIGTTINSKFDCTAGLFAGVLNLRAHRKDGAGAHEERDAIEGRIGLEIAMAMERLAGPEVVPGRGVR